MWLMEILFNIFKIDSHVGQRNVFFLKHYIKEPKYAHFVSRMQQMFYFGTYSHFSSQHLHHDDARVYNVHLQ